MGEKHAFFRNCHPGAADADPPRPRVSPSQIFFAISPHCKPTTSHGRQYQSGSHLGFGALICSTDWRLSSGSVSCGNGIPTIALYAIRAQA
jgi:hypothetical protein